MRSPLLNEALKLSVDERIELVEAIRTAITDVLRLIGEWPLGFPTVHQGAGPSKGEFWHLLL
jgi:hypothetical protein